MISVTVTDLARKLKTILDLVEFRGEEVILIRNKHMIARIAPGSPHLTALEALSDLYRTLPDEVAAGWEHGSRIEGTIEEVADPWDT